MRKKEPKADNLGVADGLDFGNEVEDEVTTTSTVSTPEPKTKKAPPVDDTDKKKKKIQFSLTCTAEQKEKFKKAAKIEDRSLPLFICRAVEEYIKNHNLE